MEEAAEQHFNQMYSGEHICGEPKPHLVRVSSVHRHVHLSYTPSVVLLRRCSDSTGCCFDEGQTCTATNTTTVLRTFMVRLVRELSAYMFS